jgi:hypothetical protein
MTPLHQIGDWLRETLQHVPLSVARVVFLLIFAGLIAWTLSLPASQTQRPQTPARLSENLKIWAVLALLFQVMVYLLF